MKRKRIYQVVGMLIIGSMCITAAGCSFIENKVAKAETQVVQNEKAEITSKEIKIDEKYMTGDIKIPVVSKLQNKDVEKRINQFFENNITDFIDMQAQGAKSLYTEDDKNYIKEKISSNYQVTYQNENIISLILEKKINEDKDYAYTEKNAYNIDLNSGKQVALYRLFDQAEDYKQVIKDYIEKDNKGYNISKLDIEESIYYLKDNYIVIYFDPYVLTLKDGENSEFKIPFNAFKNGVNTKVNVAPYAVNVEAKKIKQDDVYLQANINIPIISGLKDQKVEDKINKMFETEALDFQKEMDKIAKEALEDSKKYGYEMRPYAADLTFEEKKNEGDILSIYAIYYTYTGGAHGGHDDITYNIDLKTGNLIELKDLFKEGYDYKSLINKKVKEQIQLINENTKEKALKEGRKLEDIYIQYQGFESIEDNHSFYLKDNRLGIYFGLYEIGCYAEGVPSFEIPISELKDGIKEEYIK